MKSSTRLLARTDLPIPHSTSSPSVAEIDWYRRACHELQGVKRAVQTRQPWTLDELARIASGVVASLGANDTLVQRVLQHDAGDYLVNNAVNVAIVSVKIAEGLRYESAKLEQVALAGLLHDLGMFVLPDSLRIQDRGVDGRRTPVRKGASTAGARLFNNVGEAYPCVGRVILQEHERRDGSGYPNRLTGDQIDEMALVIGLADGFDALMSPRPYRRGVSPHRGDLRAARKTARRSFRIIF